MPILENRPISDISALELLEILQKLEKAGKTETTHKLLQNCRGIFQRAVITKRASYNPAFDLQGVLKPHITKHYPTIGHNQLPDFLEKLEEVKTTEINRLAVKILMHSFVRTGELRKSKWADVNFKSGEWFFPADIMKNRLPHIVLLSKQLIELLRQLQRITGNSEYLLPSQNLQKNPIMSENTINSVIHDMGYKGELVGHGFRAMASTILNERGFNPDAVEVQLAHKCSNKVRAAYNHAQYLPERRQMMDWWGDFIEGVGK
ncbi:MAG: site-specific integrase [Rickettsiales bacterium]